MPLVRRLTVAVVALVLLPAAGAGAQGRAVAALGEQVLYASVDRGVACLTLANGNGSDCDDVPRSPYRAVFVRGRAVLGGAVVPQVASVEVEGPHGRVRVPADEARDGLRYFLARVEGRPRLVRFFDAAGTVIGAAEPVPGTPAGPRREVLRGPGVRVTATAGMRLAPSPLQPDRQVPEVCVDPGEIQVCATGDEAPEVFEVAGAAGCAPGLGSLAGVARRAVRRVEVVFGDGARRRYRTRGAGGAFRVIAVLVPRGRAVRSAIALDAAGRRLGRQHVGLGPSGRRCDRSEGWGGSAFIYVRDQDAGPEPGPGQVALEEAGDRLLAADAGDGLCVGIGTLLPGCLVPPVEGDRFGLLRRGRVIGGVVAAPVLSVTLRLRGGGRQEVGTSPGPGYTGQYAGLVRFLLARIPAGREVREVVARDAAGRRLGFGGVIEPVRPPRRTVVLRGPGFEIEREDEGFGACLVVRLRGTRLPAPLCGFDRGTALASVGCRPRRAVVYGRGRRPVTVELTDGRRLPAIARDGVWAAGVPRRSGVAAVRIGGRRVVFPLPPAAQQCGYGATTRGFP